MIHTILEFNFYKKSSLLFKIVSCGIANLGSVVNLKNWGIYNWKSVIISRVLRILASQYKNQLL